MFALLPLAGLASQEGMEMPSPNAEMAKYDPLLGYFKGSGTSSSDQGGEPKKWTATSWSRKVLNGFFVREDISIQIEGLPKALVFRTYYGYDNRLKQHFGYSVDNMGGAESQQGSWVGKDFVQISTEPAYDGTIAVHRSVVSFGGNGTVKRNERLSILGTQAPAKTFYMDYQRAR